MSRQPGPRPEKSDSFSACKRGTKTCRFNIEGKSVRSGLLSVPIGSISARVARSPNHPMIRITPPSYQYCEVYSVEFSANRLTRVGGYFVPAQSYSFCM